MKSTVITLVATIVLSSSMALADVDCKTVQPTRSYTLQISIVGIPGTDFLYTNTDGTPARFSGRPLHRERNTSVDTVRGGYSVNTNYDGFFPVPFLALFDHNGGDCVIAVYNGLGYVFPVPPLPVPDVELHRVLSATEQGFVTQSQFIHAEFTYLSDNEPNQ